MLPNLLLWASLVACAAASPLPQSAHDNNADPSAPDTNAGASGSSQSFNLSKGGIIAIVIIVVFVVALTIATTYLWFDAKRRNWTMRQSIAHVSRRLTGRISTRPAPSDRRSRRTGMALQETTSVHGHKRGLVVQVNDVDNTAANNRTYQPLR